MTLVARGHKASGSWWIYKSDKDGKLYLKTFKPISQVEADMIMAEARKEKAKPEPVMAVVRKCKSPWCKHMAYYPNGYCLKCDDLLNEAILEGKYQEDEDE